MTHVVNVEDSKGVERIYTVRIVGMDGQILKAEFQGETISFNMKNVIEIIAIDCPNSPYAYKRGSKETLH